MALMTVEQVCAAVASFDEEAGTRLLEWLLQQGLVAGTGAHVPRAGGPPVVKLASIPAKLPVCLALARLRVVSLTASAS